MKTIKIITNPYTLIFCFGAILISGQHLGGFYLMYILLGLHHAALHSIFAIVGIDLLIISDVKLQGSLKFTVNLIGLVLMILSIFVFFYLDKENYNIQTFHQIVPLVIMSLFAITSTAYFINNTILLLGAGNNVSNKHTS